MLNKSITGQGYLDLFPKPALAVVQSEAPLATYTTDELQAKARQIIQDGVQAIPINGAYLVTFSPEAMGLASELGRRATKPNLKRHREYRPGASGINAACTLASAVTLGQMSPWLLHYFKCLGRSNGGVSIPAPGLVLNVRGTDGDKNRWFLNTANPSERRISHYLFTTLQKNHQGGGTVTVHGWAERWQVSRCVHAANNGGNVLYLATLKRENVLQPVDSLKALIHQVGGGGRG